MIEDPKEKREREHTHTPAKDQKTAIKIDTISHFCDSETNT